MNSSNALSSITEQRLLHFAGPNPEGPKPVETKLNRGGYTGDVKENVVINEIVAKWKDDVAAAKKIAQEFQRLDNQGKVSDKEAQTYNALRDLHHDKNLKELYNLEATAANKEAKLAVINQGFRAVTLGLAQLLEDRKSQGKEVSIEGESPFDKALRMADAQYRREYGNLVTENNQLRKDWQTNPQPKRAEELGNRITEIGKLITIKDNNERLAAYAKESNDPTLIALAKKESPVFVSAERGAAFNERDAKELKAMDEQYTKEYNELVRSSRAKPQPANLESILDRISVIGKNMNIKNPEERYAAYAKDSSNATMLARVEQIQKATQPAEQTVPVSINAEAVSAVNGKSNTPEQTESRTETNNSPDQLLQARIKYWEESKARWKQIANEWKTPLIPNDGNPMGRLINANDKQKAQEYAGRARMAAEQLAKLRATPDPKEQEAVKINRFETQGKGKHNALVETQIAIKNLNTELKRDPTNIDNQKKMDELVLRRVQEQRADEEIALGQDPKIAAGEKQISKLKDQIADLRFRLFGPEDGKTAMPVMSTEVSTRMENRLTALNKQLRQEETKLAALQKIPAARHGPMLASNITEQ